MIIRPRSIKDAKPGDLATYRWGRLGQFADGRIFAPSNGLLGRYKAGLLSWKDYERQYLSEMGSLYKRAPGHFLKLLQRDEITLVCYEAKPDKCHRRLLAEFMVRIGSKQGIRVEFDIGRQRRIRRCFRQRVMNNSNVFTAVPWWRSGSSGNWIRPLIPPSSSVPAAA